MTKKKKPWDFQEFWDGMWNNLMDHKQKEIIEMYFEEASDKTLKSWYESYLGMLDDFIDDWQDELKVIETRKDARMILDQMLKMDTYGGPYPRRLVIKKLCKKYPKFKTWKGL
jgi:hypothetical protein